MTLIHVRGTHYAQFHAIEMERTQFVFVVFQSFSPRPLSAVRGQGRQTTGEHTQKKRMVKGEGHCERKRSLELRNLIRVASTITNLSIFSFTTKPIKLHFYYFDKYVRTLSMNSVRPPVVTGRFMYLHVVTNEKLRLCRHTRVWNMNWWGWMRHSNTNGSECINRTE